MVALDVDRLGPALKLARQLGGVADLFKVGSTLFTAEGPQAVEMLAALGAKIFLDLKFHDIPNTVAGAVAAAAKLPHVELLSLHASGGLEMMKAARKAVSGRKRRPALLGVTILTSLDTAALRRVGISGSPATRAVALARLAQKAGLDGVVASAHEVRAVRRACGLKFLIVVPGVRPERSSGMGKAHPGGASTDDQSRVATPAEAIRAGADYLVLGRPITAAADPRSAAAAISREMAAASRRR